MDKEKLTQEVIDEMNQDAEREAKRTIRDYIEGIKVQQGVIRQAKAKTADYQKALAEFEVPEEVTMESVG